MNKKWGKTSLSSGLVLAMLIPGLGCEGGDFVEQPSSDENEFGVLLEGLGDDITDCTDADTALAQGVLTLDLANNEDAVISVVGGKLKVNGRQCKTDATNGVDILATAAPRLVINTLAANTNKIVFDLLPGDFGALIGAGGGITINVPNTALVSVGVRGTDGVNNFKMAQADGVGTDLFVDLNNNGGADIKVVGDPSSMVFSLAGGADVFNATDNVLMTFQGSSQTLRAVQTEPLTVYAGAGADILEGGLGNDTLSGGEGNDIFTSRDTGADGDDTFIGGGGLDTVDYSNRDAAVRVDIAPALTNAYVDGGLLYGATNTGKTLDITIGSNNQVNFTAGTVIGAAEYVADLNAVLVAEGGTASVDDHGHLRIIATSALDSIVIGANTSGVPVGTFLPGRADDADDGEIGTSEADDVRNDVENLKGSAHDDFLTGSQLANVIDGNAGNDSLSGGRGGNCTGNTLLDVDTLNGGAGNDTFPMGPTGTSNCGDVVDGGAGTDTVSYERRTAILNVTLDNTANDGEGSGSGSEADNLKAIEVLLGGTNNDNLTGGTGNDEIHGGAGNDVIKGGAGNDTLVGNAGTDTLNGEAGDDFINEASATDTRFELTSTPPDVFAGADTIHGGAGFNTCDYNRGLNPVTATAYSLCFSATTSGCTPAVGDGPELDDLTNCSHLKLDGGVDNVTGSIGDDTIEAGGGDDVIDGGKGNDTLYGEAGDDTLNGGEGFDMLDGGDDQVAGVLDGDADDDICVSPAAVPTVECEQ